MQGMVGGEGGGQRGGAFGADPGLGIGGHVQPGQIDDAIQPLFEEIGEKRHILIAKDAIDAGAGRGEVIDLATDAGMGGRIGLDAGMGETLEIQPRHRMVGILAIVAPAKAIPAAHPVQRLAHQGHGGKALAAGLGLQPGADMVLEFGQGGVFQRLGPGDGQVGQRIKRGLDGGRARLGRGQKHQPPVEEYQHPSLLLGCHPA